MERLIFIIFTCSGILGEKDSQVFTFMITVRTICCKGLSKRSLIGVQLYRFLYVILSSVNLLRYLDVRNLSDVSGFFEGTENRSLGGKEI